MRLGRSERPVSKIINAAFAQRHSQLQVDALTGQGSTPARVKSFVIAEKIDGNGAIFGRELMARIVASVWLGEKIRVMHFNALAAVTAKFGGMFFPFGKMMRDIAQAEFGVMAKIFPGKIERFAVGV